MAQDVDVEQLVANFTHALNALLVAMVNKAIQGQTQEAIKEEALDPRNQGVKTLGGRPDR